MPSGTFCDLCLHWPLVTDALLPLHTLNFLFFFSEINRAALDSWILLGGKSMRNPGCIRQSQMPFPCEMGGGVK